MMAFAEARLRLTMLLCMFLTATAACSGGPATDLPAALKGIDKAKFISCAGPPSLELKEGGLDRMSFATNLKRGQMMGIRNPTAFPLESCSVDAVFERDRLVSSSFSGNQAMCETVFAPCLGR